MDFFVSLVITAPYFYFIYWAMFGIERKTRPQAEERAGYVESNVMSEKFQKIERAQRHG